jgi:acyl transferase domain-containing protein
MGRQLFVEYPVFRNTILELDDVYRRVKGVSLVESTGLFAVPGPQSSPSTVTLSDFAWPVAITLPAISMIQIAMFDLLKSVGIVPEMMWGHSAGETAILYACGAGSKEMAMEIAIARGESMTYTESSDVGMAMLTCNADHASALIASITGNAEGVLEISCFNTPDSIAVSGSTCLLDQLVGLAKSEGLFAQRIRTMVPGHSSLMDDIKVDYYARMNDIFSRYPGPHAPRIRVFSTCQEQMLVDMFTAHYFWDNCRNPVQFNNAVSHSLPSSPVFIEISCHPVLSSSILARGVPDARVLCPMRRISVKKAPHALSNEPEIFLDTLGRCSLAGINSLDLSGLYGFSTLKGKFIDHPLTPRVISPPKSFIPQHIPSAPGNDGPLSCSNLRINHNTHPDLAEHVINGEFAG